MPILTEHNIHAYKPQDKSFTNGVVINDFENKTIFKSAMRTED